ncbi:uncharacterized protein LOC111700748 [Eurytemora carolleeae]|uniref:uncharacterized protein LOC111700748 n=1 Tax=Eurytemora carolleeae TaxID=1294199 RepID=UPI000C78A6B1|nr:uncharacterized protein LOC111700748 [Eurytemora carolleeae]|eukprot:XP_023327550.1 uncharacterized protein LOC111700748 [Eurytemora affinis]
MIHLTLVWCLVCLVSGAPQAADRQVDAVFVGDLIDTDHDVGGKVYKLDSDTLVIDNFSYDGNGFGVYIHVATKGKGLDGFEDNKILIPYPSGTEGLPIEKKFDGTGQLVIDLKQVGVKANRVKWLSVWCTVFNQSFGHVLF